MSTLTIQNLKKSYGNSVAVADFSMEVKDGELIAFLGPSGCGKTTTLRMIAGFVEPTAGSIHIDNIDVTYLQPNERNTGMVFQRYALFPHMSVQENVAFGLKMHKVSSAERESRIKDALNMVRMSELRDRYPRQLSGGQQQRVAIARALAIRPKVFLLDEPLSNLDAKLRIEVRDQIRELQQALGVTTIMVTHDQDEALTIADRVAVMHDGRIQQIGTAAELYEKPVNHFVADFLGDMNFFSGRATGDHQFTSEGGSGIVAADVSSQAKMLGVRPERIVLHSEASQFDNNLPVTVQSIIYRGPSIEVRTVTPQGEALVCHVKNDQQHSVAPLNAGEKWFASFRAVDCVCFSN